MSVGPFQILFILLVILVLFGRGRISEVMGDVGKGVKSFRRGLAGDDEAARLQGPHRDGTAPQEPQPSDAFGK